MSEEKIVVSDKTQELTILKGTAVVEQNPNEVIIIGNIGAPWQFLKDKLDSYEAIKSHLLVNIDNKYIELKLNEKESNGALDSVEGQLKPNRLISQLEINTGNRFDQNSMIELLRKNRAYFVDELKCGNIISQLRKIVGKIEKRIEIADDLKGNTANKLQTIVTELAVDTTFKIAIPIFAGHRQTFPLTVEVAIDVSQGHIMFYFLSDDLYVMEIKEAQKLIDEQIDHFENWGCSVVEVI